MNPVGYSVDDYSRYVCDKCGMRWPRESSVRSHIQMKHQRNIPERRFLEPAEIAERQAKRSVERGVQAFADAGRGVINLMRDLVAEAPE